MHSFIILSSINTDIALMINSSSKNKLLNKVNVFVNIFRFYLIANTMSCVNILNLFEIILYKNFFFLNRNFQLK